MTDIRNTVVSAAVDGYDTNVIYGRLRDAFSALGLSRSDFEGRRVVIKPNLIMKKEPDGAATVHPSVIRAVCMLMQDYGVRPLIAESPGGIYSASRLESIYRVCGMTDAAEGLGYLNTDTSSVNLPIDGEVLHSLNVIKPIADADVVIDCGKLKSHSLTKMTGVTKNLFGIVPGIEKFEMHAQFPDEDSFAEVIVDIARYIASSKLLICITDAVVCMEGNGPTGGTPRKVGYLLTSLSHAASDIVGAHILGFDGVKINEVMIRRGLCKGYGDVSIIGDEPCTVGDFREPDSKKHGGAFWLTVLTGKRLAKYFEPRPLVDAKKCIGCGECVRSCPKKTISLTEKGKKRAVIDRENCIRCFCCQELCPHVAIRTVRNPVVALIGRIGKRK